MTIGVGRGSKKGFIDKKGDYAIEPRFFHAMSFSEGLAMVGLMDENGNAKYGYIDAQYNTVIDYQFDDASNFHNGLALVIIVGKMAYINKEGTIVWQEQ